MDTNAENKVPSKEEITKFYKEQIEVAKMRKELSGLNADIAEAEARRIEAIAKAAHFSKPQSPQNAEDAELPPGVTKHTVTQEDLDKNPELVEQGLKVGDVVGITSDPTLATEAVGAHVKGERKLKKVEE